MTAECLELLQVGAAPAPTQRWIALGCALTLFAFWAFMDLAVRRRLPAFARRRWLFGAATLTLLLPLQIPWLRFELLHAFAEREQAIYLGGTKAKRSMGRPGGRFTVRWCDAELRSSRGEEWTAELKESACDVAIAGQTSIPFLVVPGMRFVRQQGLYAAPSLPAMAFSGISIGVIAAILLMIRFPRTRRLVAPASIRYYPPLDDADGQEPPRVSPRTYGLAMTALERGAEQERAPLPRDQRWVEFHLYGGGRPGEPECWGLLPIGPLGDQDPNDARQLWVRVVEYPRAPGDRGELMGPYLLRK